MLTITEAASAKFKELLAAKSGPGQHAIWVAISGRGPAGFVYDMRIISETDKQDADILLHEDGLHVVVDADSTDNLEGSTIDFNAVAGGFSIDNPNPVWSWDDPLAQSVQDVITEQINPGIASHGGWVMLLDVKDDTAYIQLGGGCVGCGMVDVTLKQGIEVMLKGAVPQLKAVVDTTDHASGTNPYYQPAKGGGPQYTPAKGGAPPESPIA